jgi:hypothetical protein
MLLAPKANFKRRFLKSGKFVISLKLITNFLYKLFFKFLLDIILLLSIFIQRYIKVYKINLFDKTLEESVCISLIYQKLSLTGL